MSSRLLVMPTPGSQSSSAQANALSESRLFASEPLLAKSSSEGHVSQAKLEASNNGFLPLQSISGSPDSSIQESLPDQAEQEASLATQTWPVGPGGSHAGQLPMGLDVSPHKTQTRQELLRSILVLHTSDLMYLLDNLAHSRPELDIKFRGQKKKLDMSSWTPPSKETLVQHSSSTPSRNSAEGVGNQHTFPSGDRMVGDPDGAHKEKRAPRMADKPTVQFASFEFHCLDDEGSITLEVLRTGDKDKYSEVSWKTVDDTAKGGVDYHPSSGKVVFEPGASMQPIRVKIVDRTRWEVQTEFRVLLQHEGAVEANLGRQLSEARVKIIGNDTFPAAKFKAQLCDGTGTLPELSEASLFMSYLKLNFSDPFIRNGTIKRCLEDQLHNLAFIVTQVTQVYMVDHILNTENHNPLLWVEDRHTSLILVVVLQLFMLLTLHAGDYLRLTWPVGGPSRKKLQRALLRRYLYYERRARSELRRGELEMSMTRDVIAIVGKGYANSLKIVQAIGGLAMLLLYQFCAPFIFGKPMRHTDFMPAVAMVVFPFLLVLFIWRRSPITTALLMERNTKQDRIVSYTSEVEDTTQLVCDCGRRNLTVERFEQYLDGWNKANKLANKGLLHNKYFAPWLAKLLVAMYTVVGGTQVINGQICLGFFLTNISVFLKLGDQFGKLYELLMEIEESFPALVRVSILLNKPVDLTHRMSAERSGLQETRVLREVLSKSHGRGCLDMEPIIVDNLYFRYDALRPHEAERHLKGKLVIKQGDMACFVGKQGEGKSTLLRLIGGDFVPHIMSGHFFVPAHLRVLHVSAEPLFFEGDVMYNLTFGVNAKTDGDPRRVKAILQKLGMNDVDAILNDTNERGWQDMLTMTQRYKLHLARALISNPYLLCLHKPSLAYHDEDCRKVMSLIHEFVKMRGVECDPAEASKRRPRTAIWTSYRVQLTQFADNVYKVTRAGIERIDRSEVTEDMFN